MLKLVIVGSHASLLIFSLFYYSSVDTTVCDELLLGIPYKAWWVVALAVLCLGIAFVVPSFLPLYLLPKNQVLQSDRVSKIS